MIPVCLAGAPGFVGTDDDTATAPPEIEAGVPADWTSVGIAAGLPSEKVFAVVVDGETVWAGTEKGLARLANGKVVEVLGVEQGLPLDVEEYTIEKLLVDLQARIDVWEQWHRPPVDAQFWRISVRANHALGRVATREHRKTPVAKDDRVDEAGGAYKLDIHVENVEEVRHVS